jgi:hypothetical protein
MIAALLVMLGCTGIVLEEGRGQEGEGRGRIGKGREGDRKGQEGTGRGRKARRGPEEGKLQRRR